MQYVSQKHCYACTRVHGFITLKIPIQYWQGCGSQDRLKDSCMPDLVLLLHQVIASSGVMSIGPAAHISV